MPSQLVRLAAMQHLETIGQDLVTDGHLRWVTLNPYSLSKDNNPPPGMWIRPGGGAIEIHEVPGNFEEDQQEIQFGVVAHLKSENLAVDLETLIKVVVETLVQRHLEFRDLDPCTYVQSIEWADDPWLSPELDMAGQTLSMMVNGR